ncbi:MAG: CPBP family intramembrane metalloprotease [Christensenellaceae bacterium]|nr:CPBP family intramembrane metalloprotease [Christensenellaceae bacterium]
MIARTECERNIVTMIALVAGAIFINAVVLITLQIILSQHMDPLNNVICIAISTFCGFVAFPCILMRKMYNPPLNSLGLCELRPLDWLSFAVSIAAVMGAFLHAKKQIDWFLLLIVQNLIVAFSEEFICRGVFIFTLNRGIKSKLIVGIISIMVFVFVFHSGAPLMENLIWRLPMSIVIVSIYLKRNSIYIPFAIHFTYNIIVSLV